MTEDGAHFRILASTQEREPALVCPGEHCAVRDPSRPRIFSDGFGSDRGFRSGLAVPVQVDGKPIGVLGLLSLRRDQYTDRELKLAQRVADYVAIGLSHQRLAEAAHRAALERDRAANLESSVELLRAIADVLDIRAVFPRVSEIANKVLPHDRLTLSFDDGEGVLVIEAASDQEFAHPSRIKLADSTLREKADSFAIIDDLRSERLPIADPVDLHDQVVAAGYRSFLAVNTRARDQRMGLEFWSKRPSAVDVRVGWNPIKVFKVSRVGLGIDFAIFNVFNSATVLARQYDKRLTGVTGFNQILEIMSPRIARLGLRLTF